MDEPVLWFLAGPKQREAVVDPVAVQHDHVLVRLPFLGLVGAGVPDLHRPRAVVAGGDLAVKVDVLERVILGVHRHVVAIGIERHATRQRPRDEDAVALEAQIPVQTRRAVFLDDEAVALLGLVGLRSARLWRLACLSLPAVGLQFVGHRPHPR
jgi:hypothetical protein